MDNFDVIKALDVMNERLCGLNSWLRIEKQYDLYCTKPEYKEKPEE